MLKHSDVCIILRALRDERRVKVSDLPEVTQHVAVGGSGGSFGYFDPESGVLCTTPSYRLRVSCVLGVRVLWEKEKCVMIDWKIVFPSAF